MNIRARIWVEENGENLFGDGKIALLETIDKHGSLNKAVKEFGMSYLHAEKKIRSLEARLDMKLIITSIGGKGGGGTQLTEDAKNLVNTYNRFRSSVDSLMEREFIKSFNE